MDVMTKDWHDVQIVSSKAFEIHEWTHTWTIVNFGKSFTEVFSNCFDSAMNTKWRMSANSRHLPNGSRSFGFYIQNGNHNDKDVLSFVTFIKCSVFITNVYGKDVKFGTKEICLQNNFTKVFELYFDPIADLKFGFVCGQRLTLVLKLEIRGQKTFMKDEIEQKELIPSKFISSDKIVAMGTHCNRKWRLKSNSKAKMIFLVKDRTFFVNRRQITTNCKMISRMVSAHSESDTFRLHGISPETFEEVLHFLNFGKARDLKQQAANLLTAADDIGFDRLREVCIEFIGSNLSVDNVIKYLKLAKTRGLYSLLKKVLVFVDKNYDQLKDKKDWTQNFDLILKVGQNFLSQK